jgi:pantothenate synthetase
MKKKVAGTKELPNMPPKDEAAQLAEELQNANRMITEGNEKREELQEQLAKCLRETGRKKITIFCEEDQCNRTFTLAHKKEKWAITVRKDSKGSIEEI